MTPEQTPHSPNFHTIPTGFTCRNCGGGDRGRVAIYRPFGEVSLSLNRTVTCMVLKANDRRTSCPYHDEFRGPRSDYVRQNFELQWNEQVIVLLRGTYLVEPGLETTTEQKSAGQGNVGEAQR
ncbi:uncharacterized protein TNCV_888361 [Trichonephila clavipes]|nr:uncharacterized protein TNCV_888361 [Trichonephila clavipes]